MARAITTLLPDASVTRRAVEALFDSGFTKADIDVIWSERKDTYGAGAGGFTSRLINQGIPLEHATWYSDRIDRGDYQVLVHARDDRTAERALGVLRRVPSEAGIREYSHGTEPLPADRTRETSAGTRPVAVRSFPGYSVLALFEGPPQARNAAGELSRTSFRRGMITIVSKSDLDGATQSGGFLSELGSLGVSESDARWYAERIESGMSLLILVSGDRSRAEQAARILERQMLGRA